MKNDQLSELRKKIDEIDENIVDLFSKRLEVVDEIREVKEDSGMKIKDIKREKKVIDRTRDLAREKGIDPGFIEDLMRLTISRSTSVEKEKIDEVSMWAKIRKKFSGNPAQLKIARVLYKYGLQVEENGDVLCGGIRVPHVQIASEANVDRRAVDSTVKTIYNDELLLKIFSNLKPVPFLKGIARHLGLGLIEIIPTDATKTGIISDVTKIISKNGVSVRQSIADDPYFSTQPKLTLITNDPISGNVIEELRELSSVESIIVY